MDYSWSIQFMKTLINELSLYDRQRSSRIPYLLNKVHRFQSKSIESNTRRLAKESIGSYLWNHFDFHLIFLQSCQDNSLKIQWLVGLFVSKILHKKVIAFDWYFCVHDINLYYLSYFGARSWITWRVRIVFQHIHLTLVQYLQF